ncbi:hypothetical protein IC582_022229 [Cucumis melo]|uniref:14 kDa proline-rich protein DC2.15-like n=2 Tax=Cucumis melo TaxID=3656 RepID=A0A9I9CLP0_CUCME|nr:14 kDa proline-rich protein DC2.15-like [Cucumis melo]KAA0039696.1 14 kDa proline-rich protein DC2.15-like [Cucumis melo var. makuwa]
MASKVTTSLAFLFTFIILSSTFVSCYDTSNPRPTPSTSKAGKKCPKDTLKFEICSELLKGQTDVVAIEKRPKCCKVMEGLVNVEAATCLCLAIKANILGKNLNIPLSLNLILSACHKKVPKGFKC